MNSNSSNYFLHGSLQAKEGKHQELVNILLEASRLLQSNSDCLLYLVNIESKNDTDVFVTEVWTDEQAHDNALKDDEVKACIFKAMPILAKSPSKGVSLINLGGLGV